MHVVFRDICSSSAEHKYNVTTSGPVPLEMKVVESLPYFLELLKTMDVSSSLPRLP